MHKHLRTPKWKLLSQMECLRMVREWKLQPGKSDHPDLVIRVVDNPKRMIPAALNCALRAADGDIIVRLDAHSIPEPDYVSGVCKPFRMDCGDNVGGIWQIQPGATGWVAQSISCAAAHPLGCGWRTISGWRTTSGRGYCSFWCFLPGFGGAHRLLR